MYQHVQCLQPFVLHTAHLQEFLRLVGCQHRDLRTQAGLVDDVTGGGSVEGDVRLVELHAVVDDVLPKSVLADVHPGGGSGVRFP